VGTANVSGGLSGGTCTPVFLGGTATARSAERSTEKGAGQQTKCRTVSALVGVVLRNAPPDIPVVIGRDEITDHHRVQNAGASASYQLQALADSRVNQVKCLVNRPASHGP